MVENKVLSVLTLFEVLLKKKERTAVQLYWFNRRHIETQRREIESEVTQHPEHVGHHREDSFSDLWGANLQGLFELLMCSWNDATASASVEVFGLIEVWFKIIHITGILALIFCSPVVFGDRQQKAPDQRQIFEDAMQELVGRHRQIRQSGTSYSQWEETLSVWSGGVGVTAHSSSFKINTSKLLLTNRTGCDML